MIDITLREAARSASTIFSVGAIALTFAHAPWWLELWFLTWGTGLWIGSYFIPTDF